MNVFVFFVTIKAKTSVNIDEDTFDPEFVITDLENLVVDQETSHSVLIEQADTNKINNARLLVNDMFKAKLNDELDEVLASFMNCGEGEKIIDIAVCQGVQKVNFAMRVENKIMSPFLFDLLHRFDIVIHTTVNENINGEFNLTHVLSLLESRSM